MNAEALAHAAKACRQTSEAEMRAADAADVFLHGCTDAGLGLRRVPIEMRDRAIGLKVASAFLARCKRQPRLLHLLAALEAGQDVVILLQVDSVVVRDDQDAPASPTLRERVCRLLWWRAPAKAA